MTRIFLLTTFFFFSVCNLNAQSKVNSIVLVDTMYYDGFLIVDSKKRNWQYLDKLPNEISVKSVRKRLKKEAIFLLDALTFEKLIRSVRNENLEPCDNPKTIEYLNNHDLQIGYRYKIIKIRDTLVQVVLSKETLQDYFLIADRNPNKKRNFSISFYKAYTFKCWMLKE